MTRPSMDQVANIGDIATNFLWNLEFVNFPNLDNSPTDSDMLNLRCTTSGVPKMTSTSTEATIRGHKVKQPGIYSYEGTIQLSFIETVDNVISNFIKSWREACWETKTGVQGKKEDVVCDIRLTRLDRQNMEISEYLIFNCFLESYDPGGELSDGSSADTQKPTMTLSYDWFEDSFA